MINNGKFTIKIPCVTHSGSIPRMVCVLDGLERSRDDNEMVYIHDGVIEYREYGVITSKNLGGERVVTKKIEAAPKKIWEGSRAYILVDEHKKLTRQNEIYKQALDSSLQTNEALIVKYKEISDVLEEIKSLKTSGTMREPPFNTALRMIDDILKKHGENASHI